VAASLALMSPPASAGMPQADVTARLGRCGSSVRASSKHVFCGSCSGRSSKSTSRWVEECGLPYAPAALTGNVFLFYNIALM
jgi:hypothetical protein